MLDVRLTYFVTFVATLYPFFVQNPWFGLEVGSTVEGYCACTIGYDWDDDDVSPIWDPVSRKELWKLVKQIINVKNDQKEKMLLNCSGSQPFQTVTNFVFPGPLCDSQGCSQAHFVTPRVVPRPTL